jgi:hypothetical protein
MNAIGFSKSEQDIKYIVAKKKFSNIQEHFTINFHSSNDKNWNSDLY